MIYIYFTSGTTGRPKAIAGRNKGLVHFINWEIEMFNVTQQTRVSQLTPPCHDPFLRDIFVPLCAGGTICIPDGKGTILQGNDLIRWLEESKVHIVHCTPSLFRILTLGNLYSSNLPVLKQVLLAGEKINTHDLARFYGVFEDRIQLVNLYGPTETTLAKMYYKIKPSDSSLTRIPIGQPIKGAKSIILDKYMKVCSEGEIGEIFIRTPYRSLGYYNDPELTKEKFVPNPFSSNSDDLIYKTGDLGRLLSDGNIEFIGRADREIKLRGFRIDLGEIEHEIRNFTSVTDCIVDFKISVEQANNSGYLAAYVVANESLSEFDLRQYLSNTLPDYMIPSYFVYLKQLPLNSNGKVDLKMLPNPRKTVRREYIEAKNETEQKLSEIWRDILDIEEVGIDENFMQIGGSSLGIMDLVSKVYREFEVELPLESIFQDPTIQGMSKYIQSSLINTTRSATINDEFIPATIETLITNEINVEHRSIIIDKIEPFNDLYYKNCFFNAFIPVVNHFDKDLLTILLNDIILYTYREDNGDIYYGAEYIAALPAEQLMRAVSLSFEAKHESLNIINDIIIAISKKRPVVIGVDCFYESIRPEFYLKRNWSHNLLVYGYDLDAELMFVIEHDDINNLSYKKRSISFLDIHNSYQSYLVNFPNMNNLPAYLEFFSEGESGRNHAGDNEINAEKFKKHLIAHKTDIYNSLGNIKRIVEFFKRSTASEEKLVHNLDKIVFGLNSIIQAKVAESYRLKKLCGLHKELTTSLEVIIGHWSNARNICEKFRYSCRYNSLSLEKSVERLDQVYQLELEYTNSLFKIIAKNV